MSRRWLSQLVLPALAVAALLAAGHAAAGDPDPARVYMTVIVPADAEVWFDGTATKLKGARRDFYSPKLPDDKKRTYEIRARWKKGAETVDQKRKVRVRAGDRLTVDFTKPEEGSKDKEKEKEKESGKGRSLYERLGGEKAIAAVVDDFVKRAAADPKVNFTRKGTGKEWTATPEAIANLKKQMVDMIGEATGGPQKYTGMDMKTVHEGMKITNKEFDASVADLKASLNKFNVADREQEELLKIVGSTRGKIVEKKAKGDNEKKDNNKTDKNKKDKENGRAPALLPNAATAATAPARLEAPSTPARASRRPEAILSRV